MRHILLASFIFIAIDSFGQKKVIQQLESLVTARGSEAHMSFLAADEMRGRDTGSPEIAIAANYIRAQLKIFGADPVPGDTSYFQEVKLEKIFPATTASLRVGDDIFKLKDDLIYIGGGSTAISGEMVFAGYGMAEDLEKMDVKGKIVVALAGTRSTTNAVQALLSDSPSKGQLVAAHGASALIEIMLLPGLPWQSIVNFLSADRMVTQKDLPSIPHHYMKRTESPVIASFMETKKTTGTLNVETRPSVKIQATNVAAAVVGTDPALKDEWLVISAHYDHVGVKKNSSADSIFNGARDNAIGTVALLQAAKFMGANRPKRSVLFLALTGEEKGLVGSEWYANHPLVPLRKTVFNFNCDGAGYNDKTIITLLDLNRTSTDGLLEKACRQFGLELKGDPAPEQNLYERSDNFNFAVKGIPSVDIAPGVRAFDQELFKYYHQPSDEVSSLDMGYIEKFHRVFVYGAYLIANEKERPKWIAGDKFEAAGRALYGDR